MKSKLIPAVFFVVFITNSFAQGALEVVIKAIREPKGTIRIGLFNTEKDFLKNAVEGRVVQVFGDEVIVMFENLMPGEYALSIFHDQNENGQLDSNFIGIPKEGFAFSNNIMPTLGPPSFEKAKLKIEDKPIRHELILKHL